MRRQRLVARRAIAVSLSGGLLTVIAFVFDAAPLFVPGVALALIGPATVSWVWLTAHGTDARRVLATERVVEDEPLEASVEVHRGRLGLGGLARLEVIDPFTASRLELTAPLSPIHGDRTASVRVVARFPRRGLHSVAPPSLVVSDPLELARVETESAAAPQRLLVLPRTEAVRWLVADGGRRFDQPEGDAAAEAQAAVDMDGLRPYRVGTPASRIHWPAVARGHGLIERRLQADGDSRPLVVLDARLGDPATQSELLDAAVRAAASLALDLARRGGCGLLLPGEQRPTSIDRELVAWPAAYARLAMVGSGGSPRAPALAGGGARIGAMIYVAPAPAPRVTALLTASANGMVMLVVPHQQCSDGRPSGARGRMLATLDVSGCRGFRLGSQRDRRGEPRTAAV